MKTIAALLLLIVCTGSALAQQPSPGPARETDETVRRLLDEAYRNLDKTNAVPAAAPAAPGKVTNGADALVRPAADAPAPVSAPVVAPAAVAPPPDAAPAAAIPAAADPNAARPAAAAAPATGITAAQFGPPQDRAAALSNAIAQLKARGMTNAAAALAAPTAAITNGVIDFTQRPTNAPATAPTRQPGRAVPPTGTQGGNVLAPNAPPAGNPNVAGQVAPGANAGIPPAGASTNAENDIIPAGVIKFQDADVLQVLDVYQDLTGRTILRNSALPATKINIKTQTPLTRKEAVQALDSILSMNGIAMVPQGGKDGKFVKAVAAAEAFNTGQQFYDGDATGKDLPESGTFITHIATLKNAQPTDIQPALTPFSKLAGGSIIAINSSGMLILRDYAENIKRMLEVIDKIDVVIPPDFESVVIPIKYALVSDVASVLGSVTAGGGVATSIGSAGAARSGGLSGGGIGGFGNRQGGGGFGGQGGFGQQGQQGYNPASPYGGQQGGLGQQGAAGAGGARSSFSDRLRNIVSRAAGTGGPGGAGDIVVLGQTKIIPDERTNSLLIFANRQDLATISNIIDKIDVVLAQVLIECVVMEVVVGDNLEYGFSYLQRRATESGDFTGLGVIRTVPFLAPLNIGTNASGGFSYIASYMGFDATVKALASKNGGRIIQRPRIQTSHAVEANLFVGQSRPYPTGTSYGGVYGGYSSIQQLQIGVTLSVLPLINSEGLVVMDIRQKVESYDGDVEIANVGKVPITSQKEANAKVAVRDGDTIMLGGLISNEKTKSNSGVPILKDIPLLGALFRQTSSSDNQRELIVLIRPTVLPSPQDAAAQAIKEQRKLPAVRAAERDYWRDQNRRLEDQDRQDDRQSDEVLKKEGLPN